MTGLLPIGSAPLHYESGRGLLIGGLLFGGPVIVPAGHRSRRDPAPAREKLLCTVQPSPTVCSLVLSDGVVFILFMVTGLRTFLAEDGVGWVSNCINQENKMT